MTTNHQLKELFNQLCIELELESSPPILLTGKQAKSFIKNHFDKRKEKISLRKMNAMFLYEELDKEYVQANGIDSACLENGVICLVKDKKYSLVHEMRHAYQLKHKFPYMYLEQNEDLKREYFQTYPYFPSEQDAFTYTIDYLKEEVNRLRKNNSLKASLVYMRFLAYRLNYTSLKLEYYYKNKKFIKNE